MAKQEKQKKWVCYYRVSTQRQGESGLGLEAQRSSVEQFLHGRTEAIIGTFTETESGKKVTNRPQLQAALELCRHKRATLIIARLDRLGRSVAFISGLLESGIDFTAVDQPSKDRFRLHIEAAFSEEEARKISMRTREALAAAKKRGVGIGATGRQLAERHKRAAMERAKSLIPLIREIQANGFRQIREIRDELNRRNVPSPGGARWHLPSVHRTLMRIDQLGQ
jgi:DNA invertase Pin-like site-specific DNA recombinase